MDPILSLILTGGEPYLRHDLDQIVRIFYENAKIPIITIPSNGWYLKKMDKQIKNMMEWCPNFYRWNGSRPQCNQNGATGCRI